MRKIIWGLLAIPFLTLSACSSTGPTTNPAALVCGPTSSMSTGTSTISSVTENSKNQKESFVIQFSGTTPLSYDIIPMSTTQYVKSPSGLNAKVLGQSSVSVVIHDTTIPYDVSQKDQVYPGNTNLLEAVQTEATKGQTTWMLGLSKSNCYLFSILKSPVRLVVQFNS